MLTVADALREHGPSYINRFGESMPSEQRRILRVLMACGTGELGTVHYQCLSCGRVHRIGRSCGNRHCPSCQSNKSAQWCARQLDRLLPCHYFLVTFTLPATLRMTARSHPREVYEAMFRASSEALKTLAADPKRLGAAKIGFFGVLHTWGRDLNYHPHIHYVIPGGGLDQEGQWRSTPQNFFLPCEPLSQLYRRKMHSELARETWAQEITGDTWAKSWVVDCQAVGDGASAVKYLAPYVFRVAISDRRMVESTADEVTFTYRRTGSRRPRRMTLRSEEFVRRVLLHVLPRGFQKVRHYGLLSPNSRTRFESLQWLVAAALGVLFLLACTEVTTCQSSPSVCCRECGGVMVLVAVVLPFTPSPPPNSRPP